MKPVVDIAELVKFMGCEGSVGIFVGADGAEPNEFTALTIPAYVVPAVNPENVAVLLVTEEEIGTASEPFNVNV